MSNKKAGVGSIILISSLIISTITFYFFYITITHRNKAQINKTLAHTAKFFNARSVEIYNTLNRLHAQLKLSDQPDVLLAQVTNRYLIDFPEIKMIDWVNDQNIITVVLPSKSSKGTLGLDLATDSHIYNAVMRGKETRQPHVTSPLRLINGKTLVLAIFPVYQHGAYKGSMLGAIQIDEILNRYLIRQHEPSKYKYALIMDNHRFAPTKPGMSPPRILDRLKFPLLGHQFELSVWANQKFFDFNHEPLVWYIVILLLILLLLIGSGFSFIISNWKKDKSLYQLKNDLSQENKTVLTLRHKYQSLKDRYYQAIESAHIGIWIWYIETNTLVWNKIMYQIYDVPRDIKLTYETWHQKVLEQDKKRAEREVQAAIHGTNVFDTSFKIYANNKIKTIKANGIVSRHNNGTPYCFTGMNIDITDETHYGDILAKARIAFFEINRKNDTILFSRSASTILSILAGKNETYSFNQWLNKIFPKYHSIYKKHISNLDEKGYSICEYQVQIEDNKHIWLSDVIIKKIPPSDICDEIIIGYVQDISDRKQVEYSKLLTANLDPLTKLPNLKFITEKLNQLTCNKRRARDIFALLYFDVDDFKKINDTYGHAAGNEALQKISMYLKKALREEDFIARVGGDEFIIILTQVNDPSWIESRAQTMLEGLNLLHFSFTNKGSITASIGISIFPNDSNNVEDLMHMADKAMYRIKKQGKNGVGFINP